MAKRTLPNLAPSALSSPRRGHDNEGGRGRCRSLSLAESLRRPPVLRVDRGRRDVACVLRRASWHVIESNIGRCGGTARLALCGNLRQRIKNCTIIRTWNCIKCRRRFRRSALPPLACPACHEVCEHVPFGLKVPTPRRTKAWDEFWTRYKAERALLDAYTAGELRENVKLEIFGIHLKAKAPAKRVRRRTKRCS